MIEVRKLIPQVYNQSRDFSIFMGIMQDLLNGLDLKSKVLEALPVESLLPYNLSLYPSIRSDFRGLLKNKGSIMCLLYAITLSGGNPITFEEESTYLMEQGVDTNLTYLNREISSLDSIDLNRLVYYTEKINGFTKLYINIKDLSNINQGLLSELWYYIKPVDIAIVLRQTNTNNSLLRII